MVDVISILELNLEQCAHALILYVDTNKTDKASLLNQRGKKTFTKPQNPEFIDVFNKVTKVQQYISDTEVKYREFMNPELRKESLILQYSLGGMLALMENLRGPYGHKIGKKLAHVLFSVQIRSVCRAIYRTHKVLTKSKKEAVDIFNPWLMKQVCEVGFTKVDYLKYS